MRREYKGDNSRACVCVCVCWFSRSYVEFKDAPHVLNEILTQTPQNRSFYFPQERFTSFKI